MKKPLPEKMDFNPQEMYNHTIQKLLNDFKVGYIYENGSAIKYKISSLDDYFVHLVELEPDGSLTNVRKRIPKETFAKLIKNDHFEKSKFAKRESYIDLRKYDVGSLFKK